MPNAPKYHVTNDFGGLSYLEPIQILEQFLSITRLSYQTQYETSLQNRHASAHHNACSTRHRFAQ